MQGVTWSRRWQGYQEISIHTPYAGSDTANIIVQREQIISIHTPYAGSDFLALLLAWL